MELEHLRTLIAVAEHGSMSATARQLNMSVSSVSSQIKLLEVEWDGELFTRTNQGVELTEMGSVAVHHARITIAQAEELAQKMRDLHQKAKGKVRIGMSVSSEIFSLSRFVEAFKPRFESFDIQITHADTASILHKIKDHQLDMGIVYGTPQDRIFAVQHLTTTGLVIGIPRAWIDEDAPYSWEVLRQRPWIQAGNDCPFDKVLTTELIDFQPNHIISVDDDRTRRELVAAGIGISLLDCFEANHPDIAIIDVLPMPCDVSFVYMRTIMPNPLVTMIRQYLPYGILNN